MKCYHQSCLLAFCEHQKMDSYPADWHLHRFQQLGDLAPLPYYYREEAAIIKKQVEKRLDNYLDSKI